MIFRSEFLTAKGTKITKYRALPRLFFRPFRVFRGHLDLISGSLDASRDKLEARRVRHTPPSQSTLEMMLGSGAGVTREGGESSLPKRVWKCAAAASDSGVAVPVGTLRGFCA